MRKKTANKRFKYTLPVEVVKRFLENTKATYEDYSNIWSRMAYRPSISTKFALSRSIWYHELNLREKKGKK